jgi:hypothetical protein
MQQTITHSKSERHLRICRAKRKRWGEVSDDEKIKSILAKHLKLNTSTPPKWEHHYPLEDSDYQDGWICSVCGKYSVVKRKVCDGCDSNMTNI